MDEHKITWKKIEGAYWKPDKEGDSIEGILLDKQEVTEDVGLMYTIENNLQPTTFYGSVQLDEKLRQVKVGTLIRITFNGKIKHPKDVKKTIKQFSVEVASFD